MQDVGSTLRVWITSSRCLGILRPIIIARDAFLDPLDYRRGHVGGGVLEAFQSLAGQLETVTRLFLDRRSHALLGQRADHGLAQSGDPARGSARYGRSRGRGGGLPRSGLPRSGLSPSGFPRGGLPSSGLSAGSLPTSSFATGSLAAGSLAASALPCRLARRACLGGGLGRLPGPGPLGALRGLPRAGAGLLLRGHAILWALGGAGPPAATCLRPAHHHAATLGQAAVAPVTTAAGRRVPRRSHGAASGSAAPGRRPFAGHPATSGIASTGPCRACP
jgi:hypothetical protein